MKRSLFVFGLTLVLATASIAQSKTSKELDGLTGPVHTAITTYFTLTRKDEGWVEGPRNTVTITYDRAGNDGRFKGGELEGKLCPQKYNDEKQVIEVDCDGPTPETVIKTFYSYDEAGNRIELLQRDGNNKLIRRHKMTFDEKGNMTSVSSFDSEDKLQRKLTWTFDDRGNRTEWTESLLKGDQMVLFEKIVSTYDEKGNVLTETQCGNPEGATMTRFFSYEFDDWGNWIKQESSYVPLNSPDLATKYATIRYITYYPDK